MKVIGPNITPDVGGIYIHVKSGNKYIVSSIGKVKLPNGEWTTSVNYYRADANDIVYYTRTMTDFQTSFADGDGFIAVE